MDWPYLDLLGEFKGLRSNVYAAVKRILLLVVITLGFIEGLKVSYVIHIPSHQDPAISFDSQKSVFFILLYIEAK